MGSERLQHRRGPAGADSRGSSGTLPALGSRDATRVLTRGRWLTGSGSPPSRGGPADAGKAPGRTSRAPVSMATPCPTPRTTGPVPGEPGTRSRTSPGTTIINGAWARGVAYPGVAVPRRCLPPEDHSFVDSPCHRMRDPKSGDCPPAPAGLWSSYRPAGEQHSSGGKNAYAGVEVWSAALGWRRTTDPRRAGRPAAISRRGPDGRRSHRSRGEFHPPAIVG